MSKGAAKPRTDIPGPRQSGTIADWKGAFGWIQPSKPITHPLASKRGGKVYLAVEDVVEELDGVGAEVNFKLYSDASGLGASDVKMGPAPAGKGAGKAAAKGPAAKAPAAQTPAAKAAAAKVAAAKAKAAAAKAAAAAAAEEEEEDEEVAEPPAKFAKGNNKGKGKGADKGKGKGKDKGKGKGKTTKGFPERTPLHDEPLYGTVAVWKGKHGFIEPNDTIDHPMAEKHGGKIFFALDDVESELEGVGAVVEYMLYSDDRGIGAQNVKASA